MNDVYCLILTFNCPNNSGVISVLLTPSNNLYVVVFVTMCGFFLGERQLNISVANSTLKSFKFKISVTWIFGREDAPTRDSFFKTFSWILLIANTILIAGNATKCKGIGMWSEALAS